MSNFKYSIINPKSFLGFLQLFFCACLLLTGCQKNDEMELDKGHTPLSAAINQTQFILEEKNSFQDALKIEWTSGSNRGTNAGIVYTVKIDRQGNQFANAVTFEMGKNVREKKFTVRELNNLLVENLGYAYGEKALLETIVIADVQGHPSLTDQTAVLSFEVTGYTPVTTTLYLIGDATPNGWSADQATPMTPDPNVPGAFSWKGLLGTGNFKMITTLGSFVPSYNKGANDQSLVYRGSDGEPDEQFQITESGIYEVKVNLLDLTIQIEKSSLPPYERIWIVGDATPNGWNIDNPNELRPDPTNGFFFNYNEVLNAGEFKFPVQTGNWGGDFYMPLVNYQDLSENGMQLVKNGSPDLKWKIETAGPYKIKLDLAETKIYITPFTPYTQIWMVGDASPVGWNIDAPHPMTPTDGNPYEFSYTGPMNAGEFKFPLATGDWGCDYFMPFTSGEGIESTQMQFVAKGNPDNKWKIAEAGNYKIVINQLYETITIEKL